MSTYSNFSIGSEWRKWDLHIHSNASDGNASVTEIIEEAINKGIDVIALTDHHTAKKIDEIKQIGDKMRIKVISGIEFRTEYGSSSVHMIGFFPDFYKDAKIDSKFLYEQVLCPLGLSETIITAKGKDQRMSDDDISAFKNGMFLVQADFKNAADLVHKYGGLVSVHAGSKSNTVEEMKHQGNSSKNVKELFNSLGTVKEELLSNYIDICEIRKENDSDAFYFETFGLPSIIASDSHKKTEIGSKYVWIKADPTFEGLKQILYEPRERVFIGIESPDKYRENCINSITVEKKWFPQKELPLNKGLVSIIGARGSGKTALLDFIAVGSNAYDIDMCKAGFLYKAKEEMHSLVVKICIDGEEKSRTFDPKRRISENILAKYLSQQFVERHCSEDGSTELLQAEIEHFIFDNIDDVDRRGTSNFSDLKEVLFQPHEDTINSYKIKISELNKEISKTYQLKNIELPSKRKEKINKEAELTILEKKLPKLDKNIQNKSLDDYKKTNDLKLKLESGLKLEQSQIKELEQIYNEILAFNQTILEQNKNFLDKLIDFGIDKKAIPEFNLQYPDSLLKFISNILNKRKKRFLEGLGDTKNPHVGTYRYYKNKLSMIQQEMNKYTENEKYYLDISNKINQTNIAIKEIDAQIKKLESLNKERIQKERIKTYQQIFDEIQKEKIILESLYGPLLDQLRKNDKEKQLGFFVKVNIDLKTWATEGENLIDLRKAKRFSDHEELYNIAKKKLFDAWENCNPALIGTAIEDFTNNEAREMSGNLCESISLVDLANWLYSIDHISISYELTFNEIPLKLLSPGTKGVLLMLLYLAVDKNDTRPLLIDQPEDNLDPESVYSVLVPYFITAKKRRQIIMVTHNPNLVVATDSDQVIIASGESKDKNKLPTFTYLGGGLENPVIVKKVCDILEGGEQAFRKRAQRYSLVFKESHNHIKSIVKNEP